MALKHKLLEEIGDSILEKKGIATAASPLAVPTVTEYRSSMVGGSLAIRPSVVIRQGRGLSVQGVRIY